MPYHIEILSVGDNSNSKIAEVAQALNVTQKEFHFALPPERLRNEGLVFVQENYHTSKVFEFLKDYRSNAKGSRPFLLAVLNGRLESDKYGNLFGSHEASDGLAVVTLHDHQRFADSYRSYLSYYFIRYALSFVCPSLKSHSEARGCFFDFKGNKPDLKKSLESGAFCAKCMAILAKSLNAEIKVAIDKMIAAMKSLQANSEADLDATALKGQIDIGIVTVREDEFDHMLDRFPSRRHAEGKNRLYEYAEIKTRRSEQLGIAIARCPEQGQGPASAVANDMITDFAPVWIFLVGIAGGFPDTEYSLGDVLLSSRVHDFAVSAALEGGTFEHQQQGGAVHLEVEKLLTHLKALKKELGDWNSPQNIGAKKPVEQVPVKATKIYGPKEWRAKVKSSLRAHFPPNGPIRDPIFKAAPMISGNTLVKNADLARQWRVAARHAVGVEMELGGVYLAARYGGDGSTRVLAIRGVSDIVGYKRAPEWTEFACRSAAAFTYGLITSGRIRKHTA
ncbi:MAG: hypothetical protein LAO20_07840 [Acidobacteriia bacterium]|nr:hypothetical protein [Terriglobia bacterium]